MLRQVAAEIDTFLSLLSCVMRKHLSFLQWILSSSCLLLVMRKLICDEPEESRGEWPGFMVENIRWIPTRHVSGCRYLCHSNYAKQRLSLFSELTITCVRNYECECESKIEINSLSHVHLGAMVHMQG